MEEPMTMRGGCGFGEVVGLSRGSNCDRPREDLPINLAIVDIFFNNLMLYL
ncbi:MAG: hypothetical protein ACKPB4_04640 [Sphaerospermopsis kisseleviana]